ncbi:MAG TPA: type III-B CRISPR-associated protein Cas10/Cmr2 [Methylomirabilota bacterium]|nr:type III-B CRISPR-associated protein Cas10/Cmr2 [Methylomirabilota bacterium]
MSDAILIFTFSPVQSFITEARRARDLYVGSRILVCLAKAAGLVMGQRGTLIYPAALSDDVPNKLVARVAWEEAEAIAQEAKNALLSEWRWIADTAQNNLPNKEPSPDDRWRDVWTRQVAHLWELYWAAASLENRSYKEAYDEASRTLDAAKRTRMFDASEEQGLKDTLSGCREALHTTTLNAKEYWAAVGKQATAAKLQLNGRERLDAIGATKRFSKIADESRFPSTSTVASRPFLNRVRQHKELADYRQTVEELLNGYLYKPNHDDPDWPYDGDLLFVETLTPQRLDSSYGLAVPDPGWLQMARDTLHEVYQRVELRPSPYYAIIVLDGDNMGKRVSECTTETEHTELSRKLAEFAEQVRSIVEQQHHGNLIYNGGDDVLAMAPVATAFPLARTLADKFSEITNGTASAGIAVAHHLFPLGAVLEAARQAERQAKQAGRDAVCVRTLKRSGETLEMRSPWKAIGDTFTEMTKLFQGDADGEPLSSKFAYDVLQTAYALPEADEKSQAELRRLLKRHRNPKHPQAPDPDKWAERLHTWATQLPEQSPEELGRWLVFARFVAQGGRE